MHDKITPFQLVSMIKSFGGSDAKFNAALESSSKNHYRQLSKKNLHVIDDCVREEAVFNLALDLLSSPPDSFKLAFGHKEKAILDLAFNKFRAAILENGRRDILIYDNAYQELLAIINS